MQIVFNSFLFYALPNFNGIVSQDSSQGCDNSTRLKMINLEFWHILLYYSILIMLTLLLLALRPCVHGFNLNHLMNCSHPPPSSEVLGGAEHVSSTDNRINKNLWSYSLIEAPFTAQTSISKYRWCFEQLAFHFCAYDCTKVLKLCNLLSLDASSFMMEARGSPSPSR